MRDYGEHIAALEELEHQLGNSNGDFIEWPSGDVCTIAWKLMPDEPRVGLLNTFMPKGAHFPRHSHAGEVEILVVYDGRLEYRTGDVSTILCTQDCVRIEKGTPHEIIALEDTWLIGVGIPRPLGYP